VPSTVSFRLWRNGAAAAQNFAILSSIGGFTASAALAQASYTDTGSSNQHTLTASIPGSEALSGPIEFRLYGWNATVNTGNTHVNLVTLNGRMVGVPTLEFDFNGVQDNAPLTTLKRSEESVSLTAGLNFGPGVSPRGASNVGNEFHVAGFSTGTTQQSALNSDDYLSFTVQPISGMAMYADSVTFSLWRQSSGSAQDYALFSSIGGFAVGQQIAQAHLTTTGSANSLALAGSFISPQPVTSPVEFRLYGWNAATALDSTHVTAASLRARFASVVGTPIDPTGSLTVQGDFYHLEAGVINIDLGGNSPGVDYDAINIVGKAELEGDLVVSLADVAGTPFAPSLGNVFDILTATQGVTGQFANVAFPELPWNLDWRVNYFGNSVSLTVITSGDFNKDGVVNTADYVVWRKNGGSQAEFDAWRANFGETFAGSLKVSSLSVPVPEPTGVVLVALLVANALGRRSRRLD
jgi:hypothetical protein